MRESFDTPGVLAPLPPSPGAGQGSAVAKPELVPLLEEMKVPGCASSGWPAVPKVEVNVEGNGEEPGCLEQSGTEDWLVRKVKVEEEYEEWPASPSGALGCMGACKVERPCPEELGYGELPTFAVPPWLLLGQGPEGAGGCERCFQARLLAGEGEPPDCGMPAPPRPFACAQCGKGFGKKAHLTRHLQVHTGERPFPCGQCGRRFRQKIHLRSHQKTHTGERPFPCAECGRCFRKKTHLVRHQRTHTGERPFACARCARRFAHKQHLLRHQQLHAQPEPEPVPEPALADCDVALAGEQKPFPEPGEKSPASHGQPCHEDQPLACAECGHGFGDEWQPMTRPQGPKGPEPFACVETHGHVPSPAAPWHSHASERPLSCPRCAHVFARHQPPQRHTRAHGGERPFACPRRSCAFAARPDAHTSARPFACELCGRGFGRKSHLARHQAVHTGTRPHACTQCAKRFSSKTNLARHQAVHTGHRPYACARCSKTFSRKTHLLRHERTHSSAAGTVPRQSWLSPAAAVAPTTLCP